MTNTTSLRVKPVRPASDRSSAFCSDIQFDDEDCSSEELQLESTKQMIWAKLRVRLRQREPAFRPERLHTFD